MDIESNKIGKTLIRQFTIGPERMQSVASAERGKISFRFRLWEPFI